MLKLVQKVIKIHVDVNHLDKRVYTNAHNFQQEKPTTIKLIDWHVGFKLNNFLFHFIFFIKYKCKVSFLLLNERRIV